MGSKTKNTKPLEEFRHTGVPRWTATGEQLPVEQVSHRHSHTTVRRGVSEPERAELDVLMRDLFAEYDPHHDSMHKQVALIARYAFHCGYYAGQQSQSIKHRELIDALNDTVNYRIAD